MKRFFIFTVCLTLVFCLTGCGFIHVMPSQEDIGQSKTFQKEGITLLLTDAYEEQVSERGFYAYYVADFGAVMVERTAYDAYPEYKDMTLHEFAETYKNDNGHTKISLQRDEELLYYENESGNRTFFVFFYQGAECFWTVQFACYTIDEIVLKSTIFLFAHAVEVE